MDKELILLREKRKEGGDTREEDYRTEFEKDYGRLIHSPAFRRLQGKSQVFGAGSGDYYRTRLTHTLEVAQIARQIARKLKSKNEKPDNPGLVIDPGVVECACLAHDVGHPPFGHKGEQVLNKLLIQTERFGYEGNAQNFRILMFLEKRTGHNDGLDLTNATLLATNKYPNRLGSKKKGLYSYEWDYIQEVRKEWNIPEGYATLEAQLMDLCDDIAYSTHDFEDGIRARKIIMATLGDPNEKGKLVQALTKKVEKEKQKDLIPWTKIDSVEEDIQKALEYLYELWSDILLHSSNDQSRTRRELKAKLVNKFASQVGVVDDGIWKRITFVDKEGNEDYFLRRFVIILKNLAWVTMVSDLRVQRLQYRSEKIICGLWEAFTREEILDSKIFPDDWIARYRVLEEKWPKYRFVADYISGMTDAYAEKVYSEFFGGKVGSIYEMD